MAGRIVFTVATGRRPYAEQAIGLARSLRLIGDTTRRVVLTDISEPDCSCCFDEVLPKPSGAASDYLLKLAALDLTDADEVLFLDSDSLAFQRLDAIWEACAGLDFAVQGRWIRKGHWYGQVEEYLPRLGLAEIPRFNGGLLYYRRTDATHKLIEATRREAAQYRASGLDLFRDTVPDEPCIALAMARTGLGTVLPETSDFMNTPVGLVGKLDMDIVRGRCRFLKHSMHDLRLIEPAVLHLGKYVSSLAYWRQLEVLAKLEGYEARHGYGYMSPAAKLRRSIEKRLLRLRGRL